MDKLRKLLRKANWLLFPVMYPIVLFSAMVTMFIFRIGAGWVLPFRWYLTQSYTLTKDILSGQSIIRSE